jgi:TrmH family RNA methyltransferase
MFPLSKLAELPAKARLRKLALILQKMEVGLVRGEEFDHGYLRGVCKAVSDSSLLPQSAAHAILQTDPAALSKAQLLRGLNALRHSILTCLGAVPAEWDLLDLSCGTLDRHQRKVLPLKVYLEDIRSPFNVGSIFRTAEAFGVEHIFLSPSTPLPTHKRASKTGRGCEKVVSWTVDDLSAVEKLDGVFALELGGTPLDEFAFPKQGVALIGSEELGLSPEALAIAGAKSGRVSIPMAGAKRSLNVATAFGILMQRWYASVNDYS